MRIENQTPNFDTVNSGKSQENEKPKEKQMEEDVSIKQEQEQQFHEDVEKKSIATKELRGSILDMTG
jgi:hypothetical protein